MTPDYNAIDEGGYQAENKVYRVEGYEDQVADTPQQRIEFLMDMVRIETRCVDGILNSLREELQKAMEHPDWDVVKKQGTGIEGYNIYYSVQKPEATRST